MFLSYLKSTLIESGTKALEKPIISVSVFGETQQFKIRELVCPEGATKCVTIDTKISIEQQSEETKDTSDNDEADDIW